MSNCFLASLSLACRSKEETMWVLVLFLCHSFPSMQCMLLNPQHRFLIPNFRSQHGIHWRIVSCYISLLLVSNSLISFGQKCVCKSFIRFKPHPHSSLVQFSSNAMHVVEPPNRFLIPNPRLRHGIS